jgi:integrase
MALARDAHSNNFHPQMKAKLTAQFLEGLKAKPQPYYVSDVQAVGLRVRVAAAGTLTWNVTYRIKGQTKPRSISLGVCDPVGKEGRSLAEARTRAAELVKSAREGRDLLAEEAEAKAEKDEALTVDGLITAYVKSVKSIRRKGGALRTADDIDRRLRRALAKHLVKRADAIRRSDISKMLDDLAEKHHREAEKRRQTIGAMYRWGLAKGYVAVDPTSGTAAYGHGEARERTLTADEVRALWAWLDAGAGQMPPDCIQVLKLQLCLGARVGEVAGMCAEEISERDGTLLWTLPPDRSKNKKERLTPLTGRARQIVEAALERRPKGALFRTAYTDRALESSDLGHALKKRPLPCPDFNTHDLRRTVVKEMDELGIPLDTIAMTVGHQRGSKDTRTLVRHYAQAVPMERIESGLKAWDSRLDTIIAERSDSTNVLPMKRKSANPQG